MRKSIILLILAMGVLPACWAQADSAAILQKIFETNKDVTTLQAPYTHLRKAGSTSIRKGNFYYIAKSRQLAMRYTEPEGHYFVVSNNHLYNKIGNIQMHFNTRHSSLMKLFGDCMVWAVRGDVQSIYKANDVTMTVVEDLEDNCFVITLTAKSGLNKGISRIVLKYDRATCILFHMEVGEVINVDHVFQIERNPKRNAPIEQSHFEI